MNKSTRVVNFTAQQFLRSNISKKTDTLKKFSCQDFLRNLDKKAATRKFHVSGKKLVPCRPDFVQQEEGGDFAPERHLIEVHGFLAGAPQHSRRQLEIELCRLIEEKLTK